MHLSVDQHKNDINTPPHHMYCHCTYRLTEEFTFGEKRKKKHEFWIISQYLELWRLRGLPTTSSEAVKSITKDLSLYCNMCMESFLKINTQEFCFRIWNFKLNWFVEAYKGNVKTSCSFWLVYFLHPERVAPTKNWTCPAEKGLALSAGVGKHTYIASGCVSRCGIWNGIKMQCTEGTVCYVFGWKWNPFKRHYYLYVKHICLAINHIIFFSKDK